jgi:hypothetical protein
LDAGDRAAPGDHVTEARLARREEAGPGKGGAATDPDRDRDRVIEACDRCPDDPEVWNGIDDHDGCPDSSGVSHARMHHPVNQYRPPFLEIPFERDVARLHVAMQADLGRSAVWDERIEEVICLGQSAPGEKGPETLSSRRAEALCRALRIPEAIKRSFAGVGTRSFRAAAPGDPPDAPQARAIVQVLRVRGWGPRGRATGFRSDPPQGLGVTSPVESRFLGGWCFFGLPARAGVAAIHVAMVLQRFEGLSDREAVDLFSFDIRWKYAAGGLEFTYPSFVHTVLVDMRERLRMSREPDRIFDRVLEVARAAGTVGRRRVLDSTPLYDAVATQDTVTMIRSAIRGLLAVADGPLELELRGVLKRDDDHGPGLRRAEATAYARHAATARRARDSEIGGAEIEMQR